MNNVRAANPAARTFLVDYSPPLAARRLSGSTSSQWVRGPWWDSFWMLNALWLAPIVLWLAHGYSDPQSSPLDSFYFALTALFWIGHRLSSTYLAYCTEARIFQRMTAVIRRQSDRITPVIRTDVMERPWPPYVAAKFAPTKTAS